MRDANDGLVDGVARLDGVLEVLDERQEPHRAAACVQFLASLGHGRLGDVLLRRGQVEPGAKRAAVAADDDDEDLRVAAGLGKHGAVLTPDGLVHGVELLGLVEGDMEDARGVQGHSKLVEFSVVRHGE